MTPKQKQSIEIMRQNGLSYSQIAARLGLSVNTIKSFCRRSEVIIPSLSHSDGSPVCKQCGKPFKIKPKVKPKIFCSDRCRYVWWNHHRKEHRHDQRPVQA